MHEKIIGAGVANLFIERMKLEGWLPIKEYFKMEKLGIELDWVLVLTMENDGFIAIPIRRTLLFLPLSKTRIIRR